MGLMSQKTNITGSLTVLVASADARTADELRLMLAEGGYSVLVAGDDRTATEMFHANYPRVVVADWEAFSGGAGKLCREVRADQGAGFTYVIALGVEGAASADALDAGADEYLVGPVTGKALLARIRIAERLLEREATLALQLTDAAQKRGLAQAVSKTDRVLGIVAHELKTPLAGLRAMTEFLLTDEARIAGQLEPLLQSIHDESIRLATTVDELLEAARLSSGKANWRWSEFALSQVCDEALEGVRRLLGQKVTLEVQVSPKGATMRGDSEAVRRLLSNLVSNSRKHTARGTIRVEMRRYNIGSAQWIELNVADTGRGMTRGVRDRLGQPFVLNSGMVGEEGGTGLGLAICKGIVAAHGGSIRVESEVGRGTVVTVMLRADLDGPAANLSKAEFAVESGCSQASA